MESKSQLQVLIKYLSPNVDHIEKIEIGDWIDLRSAEFVEMKAGDFKLIKLGIAMKLPDGYEGHVVPRSSTFKKWGIIQANSMGVIDNSYCGDGDQWMFPAIALRDTIIMANDRICQFRIIKKQNSFELIEVETLGSTDRGGFGSTGSN